MIKCNHDKESMHKYYRMTYSHFLESTKFEFTKDHVYEVTDILNKLMQMTREMKGNDWIDINSAEAVIHHMGVCFDFCTRHKQEEKEYFQKEKRKLDDEDFEVLEESLNTIQRLITNIMTLVGEYMKKLKTPLT